MPKKTDREIRLTAYLWACQGFKRGQIIAKLGERFGEGAEPNEATVSRWLSDWRKHPPEELAEDEPFTWATMTEPWEHSRLVLDAWSLWPLSAYENYFGPFTRRLAKWTWRVALAMNDQPEDAVFELADLRAMQGNRAFRAYEFRSPTAGDYYLTAMEYAWREIAAVLLGEPFDTTDLDQWLAFKPWQSKDRLAVFQKERDRLGREPVAWHYSDLEWLDERGARVSDAYRNFAWGQQRVNLVEHTVLDNARNREWERRTDGLLFSQLWHHDRYPRPGQRPSWYRPVSSPESGWHLEYLNELWNALFRAVARKWRRDRRKQGTSSRAIAGGHRR